MVTLLSLNSLHSVVCQISSKLAHAFDLQTPITANSRLLGYGRCHGNRIMADMSGTWWDATTRVSSRSVQSHRLWFWIGQLISELSISNILQYGGRPPSWIWILWFWTTHVVNHAVRLPCQNLVSIQFSPSKIGLLQFYNFASLAWKCLTTSPFWGLNPLKLYVVIKIPKKTHHWVRTRHAIEVKIYQGCDLGAIARKYNQDRTIKKAQKRNILHIWGKLPVKLLQ